MDLARPSVDAIERDLRRRIIEHGNRFQRLQLGHKLSVIRQSGLASYVSADGTALDLGCGTGIVACYLAMAFPHKRIVGIDVSRRRIEQSRWLTRGIPNVRFVEGDIQHAAIPPAREIICLDVLHHLPRRAQDEFVRHAAAQLETGGRFILFEVNTRPRQPWQYWMSVLADYLLYPLQEKANFRSAESLLDLFRRSGLEPEHVLPLSSPLVAPILYVGRRIRDV